MDIRKIKNEDYTNFLILLNKFRPIGDINKEEFEDILKKISTNSIIFVMEYNNKLIGSVKLMIEQKIFHNMAIYGHIEDVIVDPTYRGKKLGKKLIEHVKNYCKEHNFYKIKLTCDPKIKGFYEKSEFKTNGIDMYYKL